MPPKNNAPPAGTLNDQLDREIGAAANLESEAASPPAATSADDGMSPLEAAVLSIDRDIQNVLRHVTRMREEAAMFETFARALAADMEEIKGNMREK